MTDQIKDPKDLQEEEGDFETIEEEVIDQEDNPEEDLQSEARTASESLKILAEQWMEGSVLPWLQDNWALAGLALIIFMLLQGATYRQTWWNLVLAPVAAFVLYYVFQFSRQLFYQAEERPSEDGTKEAVGGNLLVRDPYGFRYVKLLRVLNFILAVGPAIVGVLAGFTLLTEGEKFWGLAALIGGLVGSLLLLLLLNLALAAFNNLALLAKTNQEILDELRRQREEGRD